MPERLCDDCGKPYQAQRPSSRFCGPACRVRAHSRPGKAAAATLAAVPEHSAAPMGGPVTKAVAAELDKLGLTEDVDGVLALTLARRLDSPAETGAAIASLSRQFAVVMADLRRKGAEQQADALDAIADRARSKLAGA